MEFEKITERKIEELPNSRWFVVYIAVVIVTILVISGLWAFSRYFS